MGARIAFHVYGLQRSGTNYLSSCVKQNTNAQNVTKLDGYWKHTLTPPIDGAYPPKLFVSKHPLHWIESVALRNPVDLSQRGDLLASGNDAYTLRGWNLISLARLWVSWAEIIPQLGQNCRHFRYEDLLEREGIQRAFGFVLTRTPAERTSKKVQRPRRVSQSREYSPDRDDPYYKGEKPLRALSSRQVRVIKKQIPQAVMEATGRSW